MWSSHIQSRKLMLRVLQNGKQGENKNLAAANASSAAEGAGQGQQ